MVLKDWRNKIVRFRTWMPHQGATWRVVKVDPRDGSLRMLPTNPDANTTGWGYMWARPGQLELAE